MVFTSPVRENYDLISQQTSVKLMYVENPVFSSCLGLQILLGFILHWHLCKIHDNILNQGIFLLHPKKKLCAQSKQCEKNQLDVHTKAIC